MILHIFLDREHYGPVMGPAKRLRRLAREAQRRRQCRIVLSHEDALSPSQVAVLSAVADQGEAEVRELMNEPA